MTRVLYIPRGYRVAVYRQGQCSRPGACGSNQADEGTDMGSSKEPEARFSRKPVID